MLNRFHNLQAGRDLTGALLLSPSPPRIPPAQLHLVE